MVDPWGAGGKVWQRPPPKLKTLMVGPLGCWRQGPAAATTEVEDVNGGPPGGARAGDLRVQRLRSPPLGQGGEWLQKPGTNARRAVITHFTLTQVGHFC
jgi:hypothetical protein